MTPVFDWQIKTHMFHFSYETSITEKYRFRHCKTVELLVSEWIVSNNVPFQSMESADFQQILYHANKIVGKDPFAEQEFYCFKPEVQESWRKSQVTGS